MSKIYLEILDDTRQKVFNKLSNFNQQGYLAGGTGLALQIKHRKSVDFDVFVKKPISNSLRLKARKILGALDFYVDSAEQISFYTENNISVTFAWYYYKPLFPLVSTSSLSLATAYDIIADKAHTIGRRAVWRDYVDFFFVLKNKIVTLGKIIDFAKQKFAGEFNEALFLQQLSYFKDITIVPIEFIDSSYTPKEIKSFLEQQVAAYVKKTLM